MFMKMLLEEEQQDLFYHCAEIKIEYMFNKKNQKKNETLSILVLIINTDRLYQNQLLMLNLNMLNIYQHLVIVNNSSWLCHKLNTVNY